MKVTLGSISKTIIDGDWIESKDQAESGIRLIQTGNVGEGEYLDKIERAKYISESTFQDLNCTEIFSGDILISRLPEPVGRACILPSNLGRTITAVDCTIVRLDEEICDTKYLLYFTQADKYYNQLKQYLAGTTRTRISRKNLEKIEIDIPSLDTQREVVCHFDSLITCINKHKRLIETYDEMIKSRFLELFGDPLTNPLGWQTLTMKKASLRLSDGPFGSNLKTEHYTDSGVRVIRLGNIGVGKFNDKDQSYISLEHYETIKKFTCRTGDVVIATLGDPNLRACIVPKHIEYAVNKSDCVHYVPKPDILNNIFVCQYINCPQTLFLAAGMVHGQTRARISSGQLAELPIYLPPIELQEQFADFVTQVDEAKKAVQESLDNLEILKKSLMQKYFG